MLEKLVKIYGRLNPKRIPEDDPWLRLSVLAAIVTAELAVLATGYYSAANEILVPALTAAGFAYSWRSRRRRNLLTKLILSLLVVAAAGLFLRELAASLYDTRIPLIQMLLWLQVLHSFDLPSRRDLKFSLGSGAILMAAAAVLSIDMTYLGWLLAFSITASISLAYMYLSEQRTRADRSLPAPPAAVIAYGSLIWIAGAVLAIPVLLLLPQSTQPGLNSLPLSDLHQVLGDFSSSVINPAYPDSGGGDPFAAPPRFDPNSYYGFNQYMDLRARGSLNDSVVMKVKADSYNYYRGISFDEYNGKGWVMSDDSAVDVNTGSQPFDLSLPSFPFPDEKKTVQTFYIEQDLQNIIFAAWRPSYLYYPANRIKVDSFSGLRSPFQLTEGTVYSVVSEQPDYAASLLRGFPRAGDEPPSGQYTRLPQSAGIRNVELLARRVTQPYGNRYDQALAIEKYLKVNYRYDLNIPPQTQDMDAVAYFLFRQKAGYCEQFASAMAVMARSVGIPARVVTGYAGGSYNPFTGMWEIRQNDAHAWVEIYFGAAGWVPFDPTPGFSGPAPTQARSPWMAGQFLSYLGSALGNGPAGRILGAGGRFAGGLLAAVMGLPLAMLLAALFAAVLFAGGRLLLLRASAGWRRRRNLIRKMGEDYRRQPVLRDYLDLAASLDERGLIRRPEETLRQFAVRVARYLGSDEFLALSGMVENARYGRARAQRQEQREARQLAEAVRNKLRLKQPGGAAGYMVD